MAKQNEKNEKKLNLCKETLKSLSVEQSQQVDGGATATCRASCWTGNRHIWACN